MVNRNNWEDLSIKIIQKDNSIIRRWKNKPEAILKGEAKALLIESDITPSINNVETLTSILKLYGQNSELFYINTENRIYGAKIGVIIRNRYHNLSNPEREVNKILKIWLKAEPEQIRKNYLPKLIEYNNQSNQKTRIPLNDLLQLISGWEYNTEQNITNITNEYYTTNRKETTK